MLQTPAYIRALFATTSRPKPEVEKQVMVRLARREVLTGANLPYRVVLGEAALRQNIGGSRGDGRAAPPRAHGCPEPTVSVRILPESSGYHPGLYGPFVLFDFADLPPIVYLEHYRGNGYVYNRDHVADYRAAVESLSALALSEPESDQLIQGVLTELEA